MPQIASHRFERAILGNIDVFEILLETYFLSGTEFERVLSGVKRRLDKQSKDKKISKDINYLSTLSKLFLLNSDSNMTYKFLL